MSKHCAGGSESPLSRERMQPLYVTPAFTVGSYRQLSLDRAGGEVNTRLVISEGKCVFTCFST